MTYIGLLSDTHSYLDERLFNYFADCDEIWHAGDVGNIEIIDQLRAFKPLRGVYGNIDGQEIRIELPLNQRFEVEDLSIMMTHIGGTPPRYNPTTRAELIANTPDIFICGHSHILQVLRDKKLNNMLYINPGAAGKSGFHKVKTAIRFAIDGNKVLQMAVIDLGKR